ncbi:MAG TPA: hypothetical protein VK528_06295, partial [Flavobacterium sp.]|nr:hypothetical protein [Flavobacterium sp.]
NISLFNWSKFDLRGYGALNYYNYKYDTDINLKDKFDLERVNFYLGYQYNDWIRFQSEIEFEHGGTGSTLELDTQEEFGEYETEVEAGGEVKIEQAYVEFAVAKNFNIRAGRFKIYVGLSQTLDDVDDYFTTHRPEMENEILPLGWYENGIEFNGTFLKKFKYRVAVTNGLDASGFSSRGWIKDGYQQRFEMKNTESFAYSASLDYKFGKSPYTFVGLSAYVNDAAANRPKNDMKETAYVKIIEGHVSYNEKNLRFNSTFLYGDLENSNIVTKKNASLSNNLGVKRTPVGHSAVGFSAEAGYEVLHFINNKTKEKVYPFMRYDYYDTMHTVEGTVVDNPRWERSAITGGFNWYIIRQVIFKAQYSNRRLGSQHFDATTLLYSGKKQQENTFSTGLAFIF